MKRCAVPLSFLTVGQRGSHLMYRSIESNNKRILSRHLISSICYRFHNWMANNKKDKQKPPPFCSGFSSISSQFLARFINQFLMTDLLLIDLCWWLIFQSFLTFCPFLANFWRIFNKLQIKFWSIFGLSSSFQRFWIKFGSTFDAFF